MIIGSLLPGNYQIDRHRGQRDMGTCVIEVTELDFEVRCDLRGCLEAAMALEAVGDNTHMNTREFKVAYFKSEVK